MDSIRLTVYVWERGKSMLPHRRRNRFIDPSACLWPMLRNWFAANARTYRPPSYTQTNAHSPRRCTREYYVRIIRTSVLCIMYARFDDDARGVTDPVTLPVNSTTVDRAKIPRGNDRDNITGRILPVPPFGRPRWSVAHIHAPYFRGAPANTNRCGCTRPVFRALSRRTAKRRRLLGFYIIVRLVWSAKRTSNACTSAYDFR